MRLLGGGPGDRELVRFGDPYGFSEMWRFGR